MRSSTAEIAFVELDRDIGLRRMIVTGARSKGSVLFLHGFPETVYAWKAIALALAGDCESHAFDWPGFGLSSRPPPQRFSYAPSAYAGVLKGYIRKVGIDANDLIIYATDIGALPVLLAALEEPGIARQIIVGDFAPFNRPAYMYASLQGLKSADSAMAIRDHMNANADEILANTFYRGLPEDSRFDLPDEFKEDVRNGWNRDGMTSADAFYQYYSHFTRDQDDFEANLGRLKTPVKVVWGELDLYINHRMGTEFAARTNSQLTLLEGVGHYPHLQDPERTIEALRASLH